MLKNQKEWELWSNSNSVATSNSLINIQGAGTAISLMKVPLPGNLDSQITKFAKLILIKIARPERTMSAIEDYVSIITGMKHHLSSLSVSQTKLEDVANELSFNTPMLIITTPGSDTYGQVQRLA